MALAILFTLLGALVLGHCTYHIWHGRATHNWPSTLGTITPRPKARYIAFPVPWIFGRFAYSYDIGEHAFVGRRIWYGSDLAFATPNSAYTWLGDSFPAGASVPVYYNPKNPRQSVLKLGVSPGTYVYAMVAAVLVLGGAYLY
jgi:Protein of unknown function (DUF3592)